MEPADAEVEPALVAASLLLRGSEGDEGVTLGASSSEWWLRAPAPGLPMEVCFGDSR